MTREEAIQELQYCKGLIQQDGQDYLDERDIPLLDMAIEALSVDAVSREAHYDAVVNRITDMEERGFVSVVRCKDCRWYRDTFLDTKITPTCDRHIDDRYGTLVGGITGESFCSYGERREPGK